MKPIEIIKIAVNLAVIYVLGGLLIAYIYSYTSPIKFKAEKAEMEAALLTMMPEADMIEEIGEWETHEKHAKYYAARECEEVKVEQVIDEKSGQAREVKECINGQDIGYIAEGFGKGYKSYIHIFVSTDTDFVVQKLNILGHAETPGLGDEIEKDYFLSQFPGKTADHLIVEKLETEENIQAITGVTISSRAVTEDATRNAVNMLIEKLGSPGQERIKDGPH